MVLAQTPRGRRTQTAILAAIDAFTTEHGYAPTYREIAVIIKLVPSAVYYNVKALGEAGLIYDPPNIARAVRLTDAGRQLLELSSTE